MPLAPPSVPPSVEILVRTYHGDEQQLLHNLIPTLKIFVNRREYRFTAVLDEEATADHVLGDRLSAQGLCDRVLYEPLPPNWRQLFPGVAFPPPYNRWGYDRQQWSTFYMDAYSERDILGVVDSDATFYTYLTRQNILSDEEKIILSVYRPTVKSPSYLVRRLARSEDGCAYRNDKLALGEESPYESIMTNRMPIWFWRSTYAACRDHIARKWNTRFDAAFEIFSRAPYSAFNILANYAIKHEPDRYQIRLMDAPERDVLSVAQNGCISRLDLVAGGLRTFQVPRGDHLPEEINRVYPELIADTIHLNRLAHVACGVTVDQERAASHYAAVWEELDQLPPEQRNSIRDAFLEFVNNGLQSVKIVQQPVIRLRQRVEEEVSYVFRTHSLLKAATLRFVSFVSLIVRLARSWVRR